MSDNRNQPPGSDPADDQPDRPQEPVPGQPPAGQGPGSGGWFGSRDNEAGPRGPGEQSPGDGQPATWWTGDSDAKREFSNPAQSEQPASSWFDGGWDPNRREHPDQPAPGQPQPGRPQPGPNQPGPGRPGPNQAGPPQPRPNQPGPNQPGPGQSRPNQPRPNQPGPNQPGPRTSPGRISPGRISRGRASLVLGRLDRRHRSLAPPLPARGSQVPRSPVRRVPRVVRVRRGVRTRSRVRARPAPPSPTSPSQPTSPSRTLPSLGSRGGLSHGLCRPGPGRAVGRSPSRVPGSRRLRSSPRSNRPAPAQRARTCGARRGSSRTRSSSPPRGAMRSRRSNSRPAPATPHPRAVRAAPVRSARWVSLSSRHPPGSTRRSRSRSPRAVGAGARRRSPALS